MKKILLLILVFVWAQTNSSGQSFSPDEISASERSNPAEGVLRPSGLSNQFQREYLHISGAGACDSLSTLFVSNNGLTGCMFDLVASSEIELQYLYGNISTGTNDCIILYKQGSFAGFEANSGAWTTIGSTTVSSTQNTPVLLPVPLNLSMSPGDTLAFYIGVTSGGGSTRYTDGTTLGAVYASDASIAVLEGKGVNYPFGFAIGPRIWNGTVVYCSSTVGINDPQHDNNFFSVRSITGHDAISVSISGAITSYSSLYVDLFDMNGKLVYTGTITGPENELNIGPQSAGIYMVCLRTEVERLQQKRILLQ